MKIIHLYYHMYTHKSAHICNYCNTLDMEYTVNETKTDVISWSRRTDVPEFYMKSAVKSLKYGNVKIIKNYSRNINTRLTLLSTVVMNWKVVFKHHWIKDYNNLKKLSELFTPDSIQYRFDPIVVCKDPKTNEIKIIYQILRKLQNSLVHVKLMKSNSHCVFIIRKLLNA